MNTKVEEALGVLKAHIEDLRNAAVNDTFAHLPPKTTAEFAKAADELAPVVAFIAQQDATIARMREALEPLIDLGQAWAAHYARNYMDEQSASESAWHPDHKAMIAAGRAALTQEQVK